MTLSVHLWVRLSWQGAGKSPPVIKVTYNVNIPVSHVLSIILYIYIYIYILKKEECKVAAIKTNTNKAV